MNDDLKIAIEKTTEYILSLLPNDVKTDIMNTKEEDLAIFHFNIGIWLRNNILTDNNEINNAFIKNNIFHKDDMSAYIIREIKKKMPKT